MSTAAEIRADAVEKLRRVQQALNLTLPEAIQLLGRLHDTGLDVTLSERSVPAWVTDPDEVLER